MNMERSEALERFEPRVGSGEPEDVHALVNESEMPKGVEHSEGRGDPQSVHTVLRSR